MPSPVALAIAHFVTRNIVANTIANVVTVAITFVSVQQRGQWQGVVPMEITFMDNGGNIFILYEFRDYMHTYII
jgi:hypothetical protein